MARPTLFKEQVGLLISQRPLFDLLPSRVTTAMIASLHYGTDMGALGMDDKKKADEPEPDPADVPASSASPAPDTDETESIADNAVVPDADPDPNASGDPAPESPHKGVGERLVGQLERLDDVQGGHGLQTVVNTVGMAAASVGFGAALSTGVGEIGGFFVALLGILSALVPVAGNFLARFFRKDYKTLADIQDPALRTLIEVAAAGQAQTFSKEPAKVLAEATASGS